MSTTDPAGEGGGGGQSATTHPTNAEQNVTPTTPITGNAVPPGSQQQQHPPPSPLSGCYLLVVLPEPHIAQHKDLILNRLAKGFLSWDKDSCHVDLEKELQALVAQAPEGEEARNGERLIQYATENLVTEVLIHPQTNTLLQCIRNLLASFTKHRHIIHAGYTFGGNGSWILQDGTFSLADFLDAFSEHEVQRVLRAYENSVTVDIHCASVGDWTTARLSKEPCTRSCRVRVNPDDVLTAGVPAITSFTNYVGQYLIAQTLDQLMEPSDVVGNIRFSHPTLYVFPGGQGDAALFGINGFNMLVDGGFARKACFWDFTRHLDRLDAVLLTRINNSNIGGMSSVLRKKKEMHVYPQIGHFFCNLVERRQSHSPDGDKDIDPLILNLTDVGQEMVVNLRHINLRAHPCYRDPDPINLYHKVGHGTLDMYVLSPNKDSREVREFLAKWHAGDVKLFAGTHKKDSNNLTFPIQNLVSICALLVWQPANPEDNITRILFPGSTPQQKIFEGFERLKHLEFLKHPVCSAKSLSPSSSLVTLKDKPAKQKFGLIDRDVKKVKEMEIKKEKKESQDIKVLKAAEELTTKGTPQSTPIIPTSKPKKVEDKPKKVTENKKIIDIDAKERKIEKELKETKKESVKKESVKVEKQEKREEDSKKVEAGKEETEKTIPIKEPKTKTETAKRKEPKETKPTKTTKPDVKPKPIEKKTKAAVSEKKDASKSSPTTPKKTLNGVATKTEISKAAPRPRPAAKTISTAPAKSAKDANNRKVVEQKNIEKSAGKEPSAAAVKVSAKPKPLDRKPISRRTKPVSPSKARVPGSPAKSTRSTPTASVKSDKDGVIRKVKGDKGTTDSSTVSTPSGVEPESTAKLVEKSLIEKSEDISLDSIESKVLADLKEEREVVEEIEAVLQKAERIEETRKDDRFEGDDEITAEVTDKKEEDLTEEDVTAEIEDAPKKESSRKESQELTEEDEYLIVEKEEIYTEDSVQSGEGEQKHILDEAESEKAKVLKDVTEVTKEKGEKEEPEKDKKLESPEKKVDIAEKLSPKEEKKEQEEKVTPTVAPEVTPKVEEKDDSGKKDSDDITKEPSSLSPDKLDSSEKKTTDTDMKPEVDQKEHVPEKLEESQERISTLESGATTTAPTLPEDERIPLDEIKEDIDEKHVVEEVKEKDAPIKPEKEIVLRTVPPISKPEVKVFDVRQAVQGLQRDIVKTPDEVADLPVHEEVDPKLYRMDFEKDKEERAAPPSQEVVSPPVETKEPQVTPPVKEQKGVFSFFGKVADKFEKGIDKLTKKTKKDADKDEDKSSSKSSSPKEAPKVEKVALEEVDMEKMFPKIGKTVEKPEGFEKVEPVVSDIKVATVKEVAAFMEDDTKDAKRRSIPDLEVKVSDKIEFIGEKEKPIESPIDKVIEEKEKEEKEKTADEETGEDVEEVKALLEEASKKFKTVKDSLRDSLESLEEKIEEEEEHLRREGTLTKDAIKDTLDGVVEKLEEMKPHIEGLPEMKEAEKVKFDIPKDEEFEEEYEEEDVGPIKDVKEAVRDVGEVLAGSAGIPIDDKPKDVIEIVKKVAEVLKDDDFLPKEILLEKPSEKEPSLTERKASIPTEKLIESDEKIPKLDDKVFKPIVGIVGLAEEIPSPKEIAKPLPIYEKPGSIEIKEEPCRKIVKEIEDVASPVKDKLKDEKDAKEICEDIMKDDHICKEKKEEAEEDATKVDVMKAGLEEVCVKEIAKRPSVTEEPQQQLIEEPTIGFEQKVSPAKAEVVMVTPDSAPTSPKFTTEKAYDEEEEEEAELLGEKLPELAVEIKDVLHKPAPVEEIIEELVVVRKKRITIDIIEYITIVRRVPKEHVIYVIEEIIVKKKLPLESVIDDVNILKLEDTVTSERKMEIEEYIVNEYIKKGKRITIQVIEEISIRKVVPKRIVIEIIEEIIIKRKITKESVYDLTEDQIRDLREESVEEEEVVPKTEAGEKRKSIGAVVSLEEEKLSEVPKTKEEEEKVDVTSESTEEEKIVDGFVSILSEAILLSEGRKILIDVKQKAEKPSKEHEKEAVDDFEAVEQEYKVQDVPVTSAEQISQIVKEKEEEEPEEEIEDDTSDVIEAEEKFVREIKEKAGKKDIEDKTKDVAKIEKEEEAKKTVDDATAEAETSEVSDIVDTTEKYLDEAKEKPDIKDVKKEEPKMDSDKGEVTLRKESVTIEDTVSKKLLDEVKEEVKKVEEDKKIGDKEAEKEVKDVQLEKEDVKITEKSEPTTADKDTKEIEMGDIKPELMICPAKLEGGIQQDVEAIMAEAAKGIKQEEKSPKDEKLADGTGFAIEPEAKTIDVKLEEKLKDDVDEDEKEPIVRKKRSLREESPVELVKDIKPSEKAISTTKSDVTSDESGTVRRMLVTASSEDGGHETDICPTGTITFTKTVTPDDSLKETSIKSTPDKDSLLLDKESIRSGVSTPEKDSISEKSVPEVKDVGKITPEDSLEKSPLDTRGSQDFDDSLEKVEVKGKDTEKVSPTDEADKKEVSPIKEVISEVSKAEPPKEEVIAKLGSPEKVEEVSKVSSPLEASKDEEHEKPKTPTSTPTDEKYEKMETIVLKSPETSRSEDVSPTETIFAKSPTEKKDSQVPLVIPTKDIKETELSKAPEVAVQPSDKVDKLDVKDKSKSPTDEKEVSDKSRSPSIEKDGEKVEEEADESIIPGKSRSASIVSEKAVEDHIEKPRSLSIVSDKAIEDKGVSESKSPSVDKEHEKKTEEKEPSVEKSPVIDTKSKSPSVTPEKASEKEDKTVDKSKSPSIASEKSVDIKVDDKSRSPSVVSEKMEETGQEKSKSPSVEKELPVDKSRSASVVSEKMEEIAREKSKSPSAEKELPVDKSRSASIVTEKMDEIAREKSKSPSAEKELPVDKSRSASIVSEKMDEIAREKSKSPSAEKEMPVDKSRSASIVSEKMEEISREKSKSPSAEKELPVDKSRSASIVSEKMDEIAQEKSKSPSAEKELPVDKSRSASIVSEKMDEIAREKSKSPSAEKELPVDKSRSASVVSEKMDEIAREKSKSPSAEKELPVDKSRSASIVSEKMDEISREKSKSPSAEKELPADKSRSTSIVSEKMDEIAREKSKSPSVEKDLTIDRSRSASVVSEKLEEVAQDKSKSPSAEKELPVDKSRSTSIVSEKMEEIAREKSKSPSAEKELPVDKSRSASIVSDTQQQPVAELLEDKETKEPKDIIADKSRSASVASVTQKIEDSADRSKSPSISSQVSDEKKADDRSKSPSISSEKADLKEVTELEKELDKSRSPSIVDKEVLDISEKSAGEKKLAEIVKSPITVEDKEEIKVVDKSRSPSIASTAGDKETSDVLKSPSVHDKLEEEEAEEQAKRSKSPSEKSDEKVSVELQKSPSTTDRKLSLKEMLLEEPAEKEKSLSPASTVDQEKDTTDKSKSPGISDDKITLEHAAVDSKVEEARSKSPSPPSDKSLEKKSEDRSKSPSIAGDVGDLKDIAEEAVSKSRSASIVKVDVIGESLERRKSSVVSEKIDESKARSKTASPIEDKSVTSEKTEEPAERSKSPSVLSDKRSEERSKSPSIAGEKPELMDVMEKTVDLKESDKIDRSKSPSISSEKGDDKKPGDKSKSPSITEEKADLKDIEEITDKSRPEDKGDDKSKSPSISGDKAELKDVEQAVREDRSASIVSTTSELRESSEKSKTPSVAGEKVDLESVSIAVERSEIEPKEESKSRSASVTSYTTEQKSMMDLEKSSDGVEKVDTDRSKSPSVASDKSDDRKPDDKSSGREHYEDAIDKSRSPSFTEEKSLDKEESVVSISPSVTVDAIKPDEKLAADRSRTPSVAESIVAAKEVLDKSRSASIVSEISVKDLPSKLEKEPAEEEPTKLSKSPTPESDRKDKSPSVEGDETVLPHDVTKQKSPSPEVEKQKSPTPEASIEKSPTPEVHKEKSLSPTASKEKSLSPEADKDKSSITEEKEKSPVLESEKAKSPSPEVQKEVSPQPETEKEKSPAKDMEKEKSLSPTEGKEKSPLPESEKAKSPSPEIEREKSPMPEEDKVKSVSPEAEKEASPARESEKQKSPTSDVEKERSTSPVEEKEKSTTLTEKSKSPSPEVDKEKSPASETEKQKSPSPEAKKEASPVPEEEKQKSPSPEKEKEKSPSPESEKQKSPSPEIDKEKVQPLETEKQKSPSPLPEKEASSAPEIEKSKSPSPESEKEKSPTPKDEKQRSPSPAPEMGKEKSPTPEVDKEKSPLTEREKSKSPSPEAQKEKSPEVEKEKEKSSTPEVEKPDTEKEKSPIKETEKEKSLSPTEEKEKSPVPDTDKAKSPSLEVMKDASPTPEVDKQKSPTSEVEKEESPSLEKQKSKSPSPEVDKEKSPSPDIKKEASPAPEKQKSPSPEIEKEKSPSKEMPKSKSPSPEADREKSRTPEADKAKSPSPEVQKEASPALELEKQKSPSPEMAKEKSPEKEVEKQKSPTPEIEKEKSPTPEVEKQKSPTPELVKEKLPPVEPEKQKSPSEDKEKSISPDIEKHKSPSPPTEKAKSPTTEIEKEKSPEISQKSQDLERSPSLEPEKQKSLTPEVDKPKTPMEKEKSVTPEPEKQKSPPRETEKSKSPTPEADSQKSPSPVPEKIQQEKSLTPESRKSITPEVDGSEKSHTGTAKASREGSPVDEKVPKDRSRSHSLFEGGEKTPATRSRAASLYEDKVPDKLNLQDEVKTAFDQIHASRPLDEEEEFEATGTRKSSISRSVHEESGESLSRRASQIKDSDSKQIPKADEFDDDDEDDIVKVTAEKKADIEKYLVDEFLTKKRKITISVIERIVIIYSVPEFTVMDIIEEILRKRNLRKESVLDFIDEGDEKQQEEPRTVPVETDVVVSTDKRKDTENYIINEYIDKNIKITKKILDDIVSVKGVPRYIIITIIEEIIVRRKVPSSFVVDADALQEATGKTPEDEGRTVKSDKTKTEKSVEDSKSPSLSPEPIPSDKSTQDSPVHSEPHIDEEISISDEKRTEIEHLLEEEYIKKGRKITEVILEEIILRTSLPRYIILEIIEEIILKRKMPRESIIDVDIYQEEEPESYDKVEYRYEKSPQHGLHEEIRKMSADYRLAGYADSAGRQMDKSLPGYPLDYQSQFHKAFVDGMTEIRTTHITTLSGKSTPDFATRDGTPDSTSEPTGSTVERSDDRKVRSKTPDRISPDKHQTVSSKGEITIHKVEILKESRIGEQEIPPEQDDEQSTITKVIKRDIIEQEEPEVVTKVVKREVVEQEGSVDQTDPQQITKTVKHTTMEQEGEPEVITKIIKREIMEETPPDVITKVIKREIVEEEEPEFITKVIKREIIDQEEPEVITKVIKSEVIVPEDKQGDSQDHEIVKRVISREETPESVETITTKTTRTVVTEELPTSKVSSSDLEKPELYTYTISREGTPEKIDTSNLGATYKIISRDGTPEISKTADVKRIVTTVTTITESDGKVTTKKDVKESSDTVDSEELLEKLIDSTCGEKVGKVVSETKTTDGSKIIKETITTLTSTSGTSTPDVKTFYDSGKSTPDSKSDEKSDTVVKSHLDKTGKGLSSQDHAVSPSIRDLISDDKSYSGKSSPDISLPKDIVYSGSTGKSTPDIPMSPLVRDGAAVQPLLSGRSTPDRRSEGRSTTATPEGFRSGEVIRTIITTTRTLSEDGEIVTTTKEVTEATNEKGETVILAEKTDVKVDDHLPSKDVAEMAISSVVGSIKESELQRTSSTGSDIASDKDLGPTSPRSDQSSIHSRATTHALGSSEDRPTYSDDEPPSSPLSSTSQLGYSPQSRRYESSEQEEETHKPIEFSTAAMSSSFYGELPAVPPQISAMKTFKDSGMHKSSEPIPIQGDFTFKRFTVEKEYAGGYEEKHDTKKYVDEADLDFEKALMERKEMKAAESSDFGSSIAPRYTNGSLRKELAHDTMKSDHPSTSMSDDSPDSKKDSKKDPLEGWGTPLGLPSPKPPRKFNLKNPTPQTSSNEFPPDSLNFDVTSNWGEPLRLPSPAPVTTEVSNKGAPGTPKKERKQAKKILSENLKNKKRSESPGKNEKRIKDSKNKVQPVYMDLTYVPHHGNSYYTSLEFFKRVRARYYVFSGTEPSREVYDALLEAKKTWEDKDLEVTMIPTYDTDTLGYWVADNEEALAANHIDLSPSASRCTINLQDHETSCSAYRLEF